MADSLKIVFVLAMLLSLLAGNRSLGQNTLCGTITDQEDGAPLPLATVEVRRATDSTVIGGVIADTLGRFCVTVPTGGGLRVCVRQMGYLDSCQSISLTGQDTLRLGTITLLPGGSSTEEVVIRDLRPEVLVTPEGYVATVPDDASTLGLSVLDVLRKLPGIRVNAQNEVELRASNGVQILINGRPIPNPEILQSLPASAILEVRVVTSPGAQYEASGGGGVIDLRVRRSALLGVNGRVKASLDNLGRTRPSTSLNVTGKHLAVSLQASGWWGRGVSTGTSNRYLLTTRAPLLEMNTETREREHNMWGQFTVDWFIDSLNTLTLEGWGWGGGRRSEIIYDAQAYDNEGNSTFGQHRVRTGRSTYYSPSATLAYLRNFGKPKQELSISLTLTPDRSIAPADLVFSSTYPTYTSSGQQRTDQDERRMGYTLSADYTHPLGDKWKLKGGGKFGLRSLRSRYRQFERPDPSPELTENTLAANDFTYTDWVAGAYTQAERILGKVTLLGGLRAEYTWLNGLQKQQNARIYQQYISLFPSLNASWAISQKHSLRLGYSKRINRPSHWSLSPYVNIADSLNLSTGNPNLQPGFTHGLDISHRYSGEKVEASFGIWGRWQLSQSASVTTLDETYSLSRPENLGNGQTLGIEFDFSWQIADWCEFSIEGLAAHRTYRVAWPNDSISATTGLMAWGGSDLTLTPWEWLEIELEFWGESPTILAQGREIPYVSFDVTVAAEIIERRLRASVWVSDPFYIERWGQTVRIGDVEWATSNRRWSRFVSLGVEYLFGYQGINQNNARRDYRNNRGSEQ